jgi:hypothetical protein
MRSQYSIGIVFLIARVQKARLKASVVSLFALEYSADIDHDKRNSNSIAKKGKEKGHDGMNRKDFFGVERHINSESRTLKKLHSDHVDVSFRVSRKAQEHRLLKHHCKQYFESDQFVLSKPRELIDLTTVK